MNELPIILVQGPESAQYLLRQHGAAKVKRWIVCNVYSGAMFIEKGISFVDENFYFDDGMKQINEINVFPVNIVDSIEAGDAYHGTFLYTHIALGWSVKKACIYGSAAAALSCTKAGARDGLPTLEEIDSFVKRA